MYTLNGFDTETIPPSEKEREGDTTAPPLRISHQLRIRSSWGKGDIQNNQKPDNEKRQFHRRDIHGESGWWLISNLKNFRGAAVTYLTYLTYRPGWLKHLLFPQLSTLPFVPSFFGYKRVADEFSFMSSRPTEREEESFGEICAHMADCDSFLPCWVFFLHLLTFFSCLRWEILSAPDLQTLGMGEHRAIPFRWNDGAGRTGSIVASIRNSQGQENWLTLHRTTHRKKLRS